MLVVTSEIMQGYDILEYLGYVSDTVSINSIKLNDSLEGNTVDNLLPKKNLKKAKDILMENLQAEAESMGGNAIIGLKLNYSEAILKLYSSYLVSGTGTVVKIAMTKEQKIKIEEAKEKEEEKYKSYILNMPIKELIKYLEENNFTSKQETLKNIILERKDVKENINEFNGYETNILELMQEYNEYAKLVIMLKK